MEQSYSISLEFGDQTENSVWWGLGETGEGGLISVGGEVVAQIVDSFHFVKFFIKF